MERREKGVVADDDDKLWKDPVLDLVGGERKSARALTETRTKG